MAKIGISDPLIYGAMQTYQIQPLLAKVLVFLNQRAPEVAHRREILKLFIKEPQLSKYGLVDSYISKLRAAGIPIRNVRRKGYGLEKPVPIPKIQPPAPEPGTTWTLEDEIELVRMKSVGSEWWAISDELGRSVPACRQKFKLLKKQLKNGDFYG